MHNGMSSHKVVLSFLLAHMEQKVIILSKIGQISQINSTLLLSYKLKSHFYSRVATTT